MPLAKHERKEKLGHGGQRRIARKTGRSEGHVSEVMRENRRDAVVERAVVKAIVARFPDVKPEDVFPPLPPEMQRSA